MCWLRRFAGYTGFQGSLPDRGVGDGADLGHSVLNTQVPGFTSRGLGQSVLDKQVPGFPSRLGQGEGTRHRPRSKCAGYTGSRVPFQIREGEGDGDKAQI